MATTEKWQGSDGQQQERTIWWRVSAFGKQAETIKQYLGKGSKVYVEGRMQSDTKTGGPRTFSKKDGSTGTAFELTAQTVKFLSPVDAGHKQEELQPVGDLDNIPF